MNKLPKKTDFYEFELQNRRILTRYKQRVRELEKTEKICLMAIERWRQRTENQLTNLKVCRSSNHVLVNRLLRRAKRLILQSSMNADSQSTLRLLQPKSLTRGTVRKNQRSDTTGSFNVAADLTHRSQAEDLEQQRKNYNRTGNKCLTDQLRIAQNFTIIVDRKVKDFIHNLH
ncbi:unnamed protein product [Dicrocoelium dendriticum]|nr:unnamed protein product [Dicrocoelium dendriticum]